MLWSNLSPTAGRASTSSDSDSMSTSSDSESMEDSVSSSSESMNDSISPPTPGGPYMSSDSDSMSTSSDSESIDDSMSTSSEFDESQYLDFIGRIRFARHFMDMPSELHNRLASEEYEWILDYFDPSDHSFTLAKYDQKEIENRPAHLEMIKRFTKSSRPKSLIISQDALPRTCVIEKDAKGEFKLFIETKKKFYDPATDKIFTKSNYQKVGTNKTVKTSYRADSSESYVTLLSTESMQSEMAVQALIDDEAPPVETTYINKKGNHVFMVHSREGYFDLNEGIKKGFFRRLSSQQQHEFILSLLNSIKVMHGKNVIHQDIKPLNTLVLEKNGQFIVRLIDFGSAQTSLKKPSDIQTTGDYHSPQIANWYRYTNFHQHKNEGLWKYYHLEGGANSLGHALFLSHKDQPELTGDFSKPQKSNDMWALGIMIYELFHGKVPRSKADLLANPYFPSLINGLLEVDTSKRLNIDEAITEYNHLLEQKNGSPIAPPSGSPLATKTVSRPRLLNLLQQIRTKSAPLLAHSRSNPKEILRQRLLQRIQEKGGVPAETPSNPANKRQKYK